MMKDIFVIFQVVPVQFANTLVQMDETSSWAAKSNFLTKIRQRRIGQGKNRHNFFSELFLSHLLIQSLTSHYLKPLFLLVLAAGSLVSLFIQV